VISQAQWRPRGHSQTSGIGNQRYPCFSRTQCRRNGKLDFEDAASNILSSMQFCSGETLSTCWLPES